MLWRIAEFAARESASIFRSGSRTLSRSAKDAKAARDVCREKAKKEFSSGAGIENVSEDEVTKAVEEETKKGLGPDVGLRQGQGRKSSSHAWRSRRRAKSNLGRGY